MGVRLRRRDIRADDLAGPPTPNTRGTSPHRGRRCRHAPCARLYHAASRPWPSCSWDNGRKKLSSRVAPNSSSSSRMRPPCARSSRRSSGAAESHHRALPEPDVNLSVHPAHSIQPLIVEKRPVREEPWVGPDNPGEPLTRSFRRLPEALEFVTHPCPWVEVNPT
jgi:hypothetical protein